MKSHLENLRQRLKAKICGNPELAASLSAPEGLVSGPDGGAAEAGMSGSGSGQSSGCGGAANLHMQSSVIGESINSRHFCTNASNSFSIVL